jgi:hypothetical protein
LVNNFNQNISEKVSGFLDKHFEKIKGATRESPKSDIMHIEPVLEENTVGTDLNKLGREPSDS